MKPNNPENTRWFRIKDKATDIIAMILAGASLIAFLGLVFWLSNVRFCY